MLKNIHIQGFKAITKELQLNNLAQVNYLIGPNGSGKSSVLEGVHLARMIVNRRFTKGNGFDYFSKLENTAGLNNQATVIVLKTSNLLNGEISFGPFIRESISENNSFCDAYYNNKRNQDQISQIEKILSCEVTEFGYITNNLKWINPAIFDYLIENPTAFSYSRSHESKIIDGQTIKKVNIKPNQLSNRENLFFGLKNIFSIFFKTMGLGKNSGSYDRRYWLGKEDFLKERSELLNNFDIKDMDVIDKDNDYIYFNNDHFSSGECSLYELAEFSMLKDSKNIDFPKIMLIDEPEVNLHPDWQKRIPAILSEIALKFNAQFIISTHSPFIINAALEQDRERLENLTDEDKKNFTPTHKVYHLEGGTNTMKDGEGITAQNFSVSGVDNIFSSIGVQPSDLLFANGIVWVEGPSDAIYIEKWLEMYSDLEEVKSANKNYKPRKGRDYSFQMLNLFTLNNIGADTSFWSDPKSVEEAINLLEINRKFVVITDNDGLFDDNFVPKDLGDYRTKTKVEFLDKIKSLKVETSSLTYDGKYIEKGIEKMLFWIASPKYYTIENYLRKYVESKLSVKPKFYLNNPESNKTKKSHIKTIFRDLSGEPKGQFVVAKAHYSKQICHQPDLKFSDFC
ncbi:MAG: AAA family ATPase, partial [bacterium]